MPECNQDIFVVQKKFWAHRILLFCALLYPVFFFACNTPPVPEPEIGQHAQQFDVLRLTFAGDIMAHTVNYNMKDYSLIYKDIESILKNDHLSFANFETPVYAEKPYESFPTFNVQPPYADAAIAAGFDVFSLANNHTNDQGAKGIDATLAYFSNAGVYFSGIKTDSAPLTYQLIEIPKSKTSNTMGWKILFAAITEILNTPTASDRVDFFPPTEKSRDALISELSKLREQNPCDIFILSIHSGEDEYIHTVAKSRRDFYYRLLDAGVDIVWANHVHIAREWEMIGKAQDDSLDNHAIKKLIFYSAGNTISGQRTRLNFSDPANNREYTGDSYIYSVEIARTHDAADSALTENRLENDWEIISVEPVLITTYRDSKNNYLIKRLDDNFINSLKEKKIEADYFTKRKELMETIKGKTIWR
jgi:poly-gamma-glutamate synthesis protein (capsule biosynthesis protein)